MKTARPIKRISIIIRILLAIFFLNITIGCQSARKGSTAALSLNADSTKIILNGLEKEISEDLKTGSLSQNDWQNIFPVYIGAGERENQIVPGTYSVSGNVVSFSPVTGFKRDSSYAALFFYPKYYGVGSVLTKQSMPGSVKVIEGYFKF